MKKYKHNNTKKQQQQTNNKSTINTKQKHIINTNNFKTSFVILAHTYIYILHLSK